MLASRLLLVCSGSIQMGYSKEGLWCFGNSRCGSGCPLWNAETLPMKVMHVSVFDGDGDVRTCDATDLIFVHMILKVFLRGACRNKNPRSADTLFDVQVVRWLRSESLDACTHVWHPHHSRLPATISAKCPYFRSCSMLKRIGLNQLISVCRSVSSRTL